MSSTLPLKGDGHGRYRIQVVGNSGVGKSTVASQLSEILGIGYIEIDALYWKPNWGSPSVEELKAKVQTAFEHNDNGWVADGDLSEKVEEQATDVIWLDPPFMLYFPRLFYRTILRYVGLRPPCSPGCTDTLAEIFSLGEKSILWWCWAHHDTVRRTQTIKLAENAENRRRIGGWGSELKRWLEDVKRLVRDDHHTIHA